MSNDRTRNFDALLLTHLLVARGGDTVDSIIVGPETVGSPAAGKPDNTPTTNWTELGTVDEFEPKSDEKYVPRYRNVAGKRVLRGNVLVSQQMTYMVSLQDANIMLLELIWGINGKSDATTGAFQPGMKVAPVQLWAKFQQYSAVDGQTLMVASDVWCEATVGSYKFNSGKLDNYALMLTQLYSSLNTGAFTNI